MRNNYKYKLFQCNIEGIEVWIGVLVYNDKIIDKVSAWGEFGAKKAIFQKYYGYTSKCA